MLTIAVGGPARKLTQGAAALQRDGSSAPAQADRAELSTATGPQRAQAWVETTKGKLLHAKPEELKAIASESPKILALPGLSKENESFVRLMAAAAYGLLAKQKIDRRSNAGKAFNEVRSAYNLSPDNLWCATGYARALVALDNLNWFVHKLAEAALKVDTKAECRRVLPTLAALPDYPQAAILRVKMAGIAKDRKAKAEAEAALEKLTARDPEGVKKAYADLGGDAQAAKEAGKEIK